MISKERKSPLLKPVSLLLILLSLVRFLCLELGPRCIPVGILMVSSCADERPPTGGRKDSIPPKVKYAIPVNKTLNFHEDKVKIRFQEYIQQSLDPKEILVSPPMAKNPKMIVNGKNLIVLFKSKLKENTTYTINFGDAVKDINEGNILKNFTYVFATGDKLDTAKIYGSLTNAAVASELDNIIVSLYPIDSVDGILHSKPYYFAKSDKSGSFKINNIHSGSYRVYALKDDNLNYIFDQSTELIGFLDSTVTVNDSSNLKLNLTVFESVNHKPKFIDGVGTAPGKAVLYYNSSVKTLKLNSDILTPDDVTDINTRKDTITYWYSNVYAKKAKIELTANDTIFDSTTVDLKYLNKDSSSNKTKYALSFESQSVRKDTGSKAVFEKPVLSPFKPLILFLSRPVGSIDPYKKLLITNDSTGKVDSVRGTIGQGTKRDLHIDYHQIEKKSYTLTVPDSTFLDIRGWWNKKFYYRWVADAEENYGTVILNLKFEHPENYYVLKLLDHDNKAVETFYYVGNEEKKVILKNVKAGSYHLQAIEDRNKNGEWDSGDFYKKLQPERVINFRETYELKGNWELEIEIKL